MNLQEIVDTLAPLVDHRNHEVGGPSKQVYLTYAEYDAIEKVVAMLNLANITNYSKAQASHPRLLQAVKLILSIADHPEANPTEVILLSTKTRAQLDSAVEFAEK